MYYLDLMSAWGYLHRVKKYVDKPFLPYVVSPTSLRGVYEYDKRLGSLTFKYFKRLRSNDPYLYPILAMYIARQRAWCTLEPDAWLQYIIDERIKYTYDEI